MFEKSHLSLQIILIWLVYSGGLVIDHQSLEGLPTFPYLVVHFQLRMEILPMGRGTRGYPTRMGMVWVHFYTHR